MDASITTYPLPKTMLYSIAGTMDTLLGSLEPPKTAFFGGYFKKEGQNSAIQGQLIDPHGQATIEGVLHADTLEFVKKYENGPSVEAQIEYHLQKSTHGLWEGTFTFKQGDKNVRGNTTCQISFVQLPNIEESSPNQ